MRRTQSTYMKWQTKWARVPAMIEAHRGDDVVAVRIHPERPVGSEHCDAATIYLDAHEAQGFAAWLSEQADHMRAKKAKAEARRAARAAARKGGPS